MKSKYILINTSSFDIEKNESIKKIQNLGFVIRNNPLARRLSEEELVDIQAEFKPVGIIAGLEPFTESALNINPELKVISRVGTGIDNIDLQVAKKFGIVIKNTPDAVTPAVSELTIGLILNLLRRISISDRSIKSGAFEKIMGNLLKEKIVGVIGYGRVGRRVADICIAFGARILVHDVNPDVVNKEDIEIQDLDDLLKKSDIVSLHIPVLPEKGYFLGEEQIKMMKKGSIIINTARGRLIDEDALYNAVKSGYLRGAALDVFEEEPYKGPLTELDNVLLTAHIGSYAKEVRVNMENEAAKNLLNELINISQ